MSLCCVRGTGCTYQEENKGYERRGGFYFIWKAVQCNLGYARVSHDSEHCVLEYLVM